MKACASLACNLLMSTAVLADPALPEADRIRLAEAFCLAESVTEEIWPGWSEVPFSVLLVTPDHEFLMRHPRPSDDFRTLGYDALLQSEVYVRDRQFSPSLLATFPAVGGVSTVVIGQPESTGKSSTFWVITALHEHFHQLQNAQPDYYEAVAGLDLAGGDETGMWMLNYPFPYESDEVVRLFGDYLDTLRRAIDSSAAAVEAGSPPENPRAVRSVAQFPLRHREALIRDYLAARSRLREGLSGADYRYMSFQLWQEGVARYTEYRVANAAARFHEPLASFRALEDFTPYAEAADSLRRAHIAELERVDLAGWQRVAFYPVGAAEALILDAEQPAWQHRYFDERFYLERYHAPRPMDALATADTVFFDDFAADSLDRSIWNVRITGRTVNDEQQAYVDSPETIYIVHGDDAEGATNGALALHPRSREGFNTPEGRNFDFVSGRIDTRGKLEFTYGKASARIKLTEGPGLWPAFWAMGTGRWPDTGEIDIMEYVGEPDWTGVALHGPGYSGETPLVNKVYFPPDGDATGWRIYSVDWSPDGLLFYVDGNLMYRATRPMVEHYGEWAFDNPKYLILNFALGGAYPYKTNGVDSPYHGIPEETVARIRSGESRMLVDWVLVTGRKLRQNVP